MKRRRVRFTATALRHVDLEKSWWLENRTHTEIFATELEEALRILALLPGAGALYTQAGVEGLRRLYLPKVACHLYYTFDEHEVFTRALWGLAAVEDQTSSHPSLTDGLTPTGTFMMSAIILGS